MSNVIDFLEMIGQNAQLRHASRDAMEVAMANSQIAPELQAAILSKDQQQLEAVLGASNVCCMLIPATVCCMLIPGMSEEMEFAQELCA